MGNPRQRAEARSRVWQLLAMGFSHPLPELFVQMADGTFQSALMEAITTVHGNSPVVLAPVQCDFTTFEAQYIALFETGQKGRPAVPLCAGEYIDLLDGQPRPALMLKYAQFYRHFGLKVRDQGEDNELPDHLTCQLECLAWLAHLETQALSKNQTAEGYQRAQRDFIGKLLLRFSTGFDVLLTQECHQRGYQPLFPALSQTLCAFQQQTLFEFESLYGATTAAQIEPEAAVETEQDLWS